MKYPLPYGPTGRDQYTFHGTGNGLVTVENREDPLDDGYTMTGEQAYRAIKGLENGVSSLHVDADGYTKEYLEGSQQAGTWKEFWR